MTNTHVQDWCLRGRELTLRLSGAVLAQLLMVAMLAWVWLDPSALVAGLSWLGWCAAIRLWGLAVGTRPGRGAYLAALLPATSPFLVLTGWFTLVAVLAG